MFDPTGPVDIPPDASEAASGASLSYFAELANRMSGSGTQYRSLLHEAVESHKKWNPEADASDFARRLNRALFLKSDYQGASVRNAGPVHVLTHTRAARQGNASGILATCLAAGSKLSWDEGKVVFSIAKEIEAAAGGIARHLSGEKREALARIVVALVREQQKMALHVPTIFRTARDEVLRPVSKSKQETSLLARFKTSFRGCDEPADVIRDLLSRSRSVAFAEPALMSALCTDTFDSFTECYPNVQRKLIPALLVSALNEVTQSASFSCSATGSPSVVVFRDVRLAWRLNPHGNFSVQWIEQTDDFVDFVASKVASMLETLLRNSVGWLGKQQHSQEFTNAVLRSITFLAPSLDD